MIQRTFTLGDHWLYFKIYTGYKTEDTVLEQLLYPLIKKLLASKKISHWFFIRYSDPDFHVRLRFYLPDVNGTGAVVNIINSKLQSYIDNQLIWKLQYDTYHREIERYGETTMELSEQLFYYDSEMIIHIIKQKQRDS